MIPFDYFFVNWLLRYFLKYTISLKLSIIMVSKPLKRRVFSFVNFLSVSSHDPRHNSWTQSWTQIAILKWEIGKELPMRVHRFYHWTIIGPISFHFNISLFSSSFNTVETLSLESNLLGVCDSWRNIADLFNSYWSIVLVQTPHSENNYPYLSVRMGKV